MAGEWRETSLGDLVDFVSGGHLDKQADQGWGSRVIDRLAADLREAFLEMKGFSPRNLKYMRAFAAAWPEQEIVQHTVSQLSWRLNLALIEKRAYSRDRLWYAAKMQRHGPLIVQASLHNFAQLTSCCAAT